MRTVIAFLVSMALAPVLAQSSNSYRVTHTYVLGGEGGWDYIVPDPPKHRLFIARQNRVMVVDEDTGDGARRGQRPSRRPRHGRRG